MSCGALASLQDALKSGDGYQGSLLRCDPRLPCATFQVGKGREATTDGEHCDTGLTLEPWKRGQDSHKGAEARREGTQGRRFWVELSDWSAEQRFPAERRDED
jgi:hypothetical protein